MPGLGILITESSSFTFQERSITPASKVWQHSAIYSYSHHDVDDNTCQAIDEGE